MNDTGIVTYTIKTNIVAYGVDPSALGAQAIIVVAVLLLVVGIYLFRRRRKPS